MFTKQDTFLYVLSDIETAVDKLRNINDLTFLLKFY
jgi:hypothetical protein